MPEFNEYVDRINEVTEASRNEDDPEKKEALHKEFWRLAIDAFNEHIAGDITTVDGRVIHTPTIDI